jgi:hypothetical protein
MEAHSRFANLSRALFQRQGYIVLESELLWIWLPAGLFAATVLILRTAAGRGGADLSNQE